MAEGANAGSSRSPAAKPSGLFPLLVAAQSGHTGIVKALVDNGADVHQRHEPSGLSPLSLAQHRGHTEITDLLIAARAQPD